MIYTKYIWRLFWLLIIGSQACTPKGPEFVDELDLVITSRDNNINFDDFLTYTLADSVVFISNEDESLAEETEDFLLTEVNEKFSTYGWQEAQDPASEGSDVILLITVINTVNFNLVGWWDYWGWWPGWGWYSPGYPPGGWYPGYPGGCCYFGGVYSYREGTVLIEMITPNGVTVNNNNAPNPIPVIWTGALNGLLSGSQSNIENRISSGLERMFIDSPYLNK
ncbi:DUF4136 domain-containing protein [Echinicola marina]|uniref:DUF4136 domain-containing protein n=1 Tax=Echinicola marina TaxID=2859768 RepID=UPI001CF69A8D|nr:DUF4136 domain-containing protein [Echinicola marina]UCS93383.1 DUF4136 domain-containing protein [Echinicola marina]